MPLRKPLLHPLFLPTYGGQTGGVHLGTAMLVEAEREERSYLTMHYEYVVRFINIITKVKSIIKVLE